jgi:phosphotransferase system  glucose/maltose/N-acetylglucosamine-specific IIC component
MIELINLLASIGGAFLYSFMTFITYLLLEKQIDIDFFKDSDISWLICICVAWFITLPIIFIMYTIRFFIKFYNLFKLEEKVNDLETELKRLKRKK